MCSTKFLLAIHETNKVKIYNIDYFPEPEVFGTIDCGENIIHFICTLGIIKLIHSTYITCDIHILKIYNKYMFSSKFIFGQIK